MEKLYGTDMSDAAWALVEPHWPAPLPSERPRTTCLRSVVNAIFYLLQTGCQWRRLPRAFPPKSMVYHDYSVWRQRGVWTRLQWALHKLARRARRMPDVGDHRRPVRVRVREAGAKHQAGRAQDHRARRYQRLRRT